MVTLENMAAPSTVCLGLCKHSALDPGVLLSVSHCGGLSMLGLMACVCLVPSGSPWPWWKPLEEEPSSLCEPLSSLSTQAGQQPSHLATNLSPEDQGVYPQAASLLTKWHQVLDGPSWAPRGSSNYLF